MVLHKNQRNFRLSVRDDALPRLIRRLRLAQSLSLHAINFKGRQSALNVLHRNLLLLLTHYPEAISQISLDRDRHDRLYILFTIIDGSKVGAPSDAFMPSVQKLFLGRQQLPLAQPQKPSIAA
jgi:hypothetical protein